MTVLWDHCLEAKFSERLALGKIFFRHVEHMNVDRC
jgi:hypothetical protein